MHYKQTILSITTCASVLLELSSSSSSQSSSQSSSGCCTKSAVWLLTAPAFHAAGCCCWYAGTCTAAEVGCQVWLGGGGGGIDGSLNEVICTQRIQSFHLLSATDISYIHSLSKLHVAAGSSTSSSSSLDCLHNHRSEPDLSSFSIYFLVRFIFNFSVCPVWWTKLAALQLFTAR